MGRNALLMLCMSQILLHPHDQDLRDESMGLHREPDEKVQGL